MADTLPSAAPENGGDNQGAANYPADKEAAEPKKKFQPPKRKARKDSKLTGLEWGGFFADIYVTLWVWSDLIACHDIKRLIFLLAAVFVAHGVLCYFLSKIFNSWRWALMVWFALSITATWIAIPPSEPKPYPHFKFSLCVSSDPDNIVYLTNDFLRVSGFSDVKPNPVNLDGFVIFRQQPEQSNVVLRLFIASDTLSEDTIVTIHLSQAWKCVPNSAWIKTVPGNVGVIENSPGVFSTNVMRSWGYRLPAALLPGTGQGIAPIQISQLPNPDSIQIMARDKNSPAEAVGFQLFFAPTSSVVFRKPFVIQGEDLGHGRAKVSISREKLEELEK
jgi:hypothetical protein